MGGNRAALDGFGPITPAAGRISADRLARADGDIEQPVFFRLLLASVDGCHSTSGDLRRWAANLSCSADLETVYVCVITQKRLLDTITL